ncbi:putative Uncharacterized Na(+)/H(+) antiporter C15A10.06 [Glarea lozoyensis 74030]|uniref:Putative Uncharacterized Na(+)/H(+) antiporter C15A10.06 n=1 Tax=Glarea lozoyensis (strain ATCC 74030 / MF5533) TaxID=1104152 RepID=H0EJX2_GLAL7|nr:putative Uncharacterized Na(+)/H(+) antiporter C15A10.06 [Glarea lozoyensis 74030]
MSAVIASVAYQLLKRDDDETDGEGPDTSQREIFSSWALFIMIMLLITALFTSYMLQQKKIEAVHETVISIFAVDPKLYTIIFGESILNDAVAIVLFETAQRYKEGGAAGTLGFVSLLEGIGIFLAVFFGSLIIGVMIGIGTALMLKYRAKRRGKEVPDELPYSYQAMLFWAGLRGAVGVALAAGMTGPNSWALKATVLVVVVLTVIIFGGTTARMLEIMGIRTGVVEEIDSDDEFDIESHPGGSYYKSSGNGIAPSASKA